MNEKAARSKPIDKWIPWFFVLFFVVIAVLDGIFVTLAVTTHTGTVTELPYKQGIAYNETLKQAEDQQALGWQAEIDLIDNREIAVNLRDQAQKPLTGAAILAKVTRPVQDGYDFELPLIEREVERGDGIYSATADFPLPGQWHIRIFVTWQDTPYQSSRMIMVR